METYNSLEYSFNMTFLYSVWKTGAKRQLAEFYEDVILRSHAEHTVDLETIGDVGVEDVTAEMNHELFQAEERATARLFQSLTYM